MWLYTGLDQRTIFKYATSSSFWFSHASFKALNRSIALASTLSHCFSTSHGSHHWYHQHSQLQLLLSSQNHCSLVELFSDPEWVWWWQSSCFLQHFPWHLWHIYIYIICFSEFWLLVYLIFCNDIAVDIRLLYGRFLWLCIELGFLWELIRLYLRFVCLLASRSVGYIWLTITSATSTLTLGILDTVKEWDTYHKVGQWWMEVKSVARH